MNGAAQDGGYANAVTGGQRKIKQSMHLPRGGKVMNLKQAVVGILMAGHAYPLNYGAIERYVNAHKEMGHDANNAGRCVA
jgi:hypothetical protein